MNKFTIWFLIFLAVVIYLKVLFTGLPVEPSVMIPPGDEIQMILGN